ncbi:MAG: sulfite exporter TauE/SafE family protein [Gemmataceae bacterium]|nr:sulfite exporter TauE/SafE family protein [Gemmataceae bacterium]MCS7270227.1 sulfite exporter TauE/SafE family protein [Gemmataceae bacterium]MDW8241641.1 sulfite exporter TauE/SafE family protein [Thermogemmata sp.]
MHPGRISGHYSMTLLSEGETAVLTVLLFAAAVLYSSVGHAGASGYLAAMSLFGLAPETMKPAALVLNIAVATLGTWRFVQAGCFQLRTWFLFTLFSLPCAALGGYLSLPAAVYKPIVGLVLLFAALRLWLEPTRREQERGTGTAESAEPVRPLPWVAAACWGSGIGLLSGLTGTGGGIFLSPLLLLQRWATTRQSAGIAAAFILVNSLAGLGGLISSRGLVAVPSALGLWLVAVVGGGWLGTHLGTRYARISTLRKLLGVVLVIAAGKMLLADNAWMRLLVWVSKEE